MRAEYETLKAPSGIGPAFERWFTARCDNAGIVAVGAARPRAQLHGAAPRRGGDLSRFYARVKALAVPAGGSGTTSTLRSISGAAR